MLKMSPTLPSPIIIFHPSLIRSNLPQCKPHLWSGVSVFGKERWAKGDLLFLFLPPQEKGRKEGPPDGRLTKLRDNRKAVFSCLSETTDSSYEYQGGGALELLTDILVRWEKQTCLLIWRRFCCSAEIYNKDKVDIYLKQWHPFFLWPLSRVWDFLLTQVVHLINVIVMWSPLRTGFTRYMRPTIRYWI